MNFLYAVYVFLPAAIFGFVLPGIWYSVGPVALAAIVADQLRRGSLREMDWIVVVAAMVLAYVGAWAGTLIRHGISRRLND